MTSRAAVIHREDRADMDAATIAVLITGAVSLAGALIAGFWQFVTGRKKNQIDAQGALVTGFVALLAEFKNERTQLVARIGELEANNQRQDRRIGKLERLMLQHNIDIPPDGPE